MSEGRGEKVRHLPHCYPTSLQAQGGFLPHLHGGHQAVSLRCWLTDPHLQDLQQGLAIQFGLGQISFQPTNWGQNCFHVSMFIYQNLSGKLVFMLVVLNRVSHRGVGKCWNAPAWMNPAFPWTGQMADTLYGVWRGSLLMSTLWMEWSHIYNLYFSPRVHGLLVL